MIVHPLFQEEDDGLIPISPLQLHVASIPLRLAIDLNARWHSRFPYINEFNVNLSGNVRCFSASFKNRFYAVAIWSRPIAANRLKDGHRCLELRRMAIADAAPTNTASRMLAVMTRLIYRDMPEIHRLVSYQDTEAHTGTIYKASGWSPHQCGSFVDWSTHRSAPGRVTQSTAPKVRWEKELRQNRDWASK